MCVKGILLHASGIVYTETLMTEQLNPYLTLKLLFSYNLLIKKEKSLYSTCPEGPKYGSQRPFRLRV